MSWLSTLIKKNSRGTSRLIGKVAAPLAVGAMAIPGVGPAVSGAIASAGRAIGRLGSTVVGKATGALDAVTRGSSTTAETLAGLPGDFASGLASGAGAGAVAGAASRFFNSPAGSVLVLGSLAAVAYKAFTSRGASQPPRRNFGGRY